MEETLEQFKRETIRKMLSDPNKLTNGLINIGFDISKDKDHCSLIVAKYRGNHEVMIINEFYDEEAAHILELLLGKNEE